MNELDIFLATVIMAGMRSARARAWMMKRRNTRTELSKT
jgi:hypothetical protein